MKPEMFPARTEFSLAAHLDEQMAREETIPARVWFSDTAQVRAKNESYATLVEVQRRDGGIEFTLYTYSLAWLARWILSFGADAEAVEPVELREQVRVAASAAAEKHRV